MSSVWIYSVVSSLKDWPAEESRAQGQGLQALREEAKCLFLAPGPQEALRKGSRGTRKGFMDGWPLPSEDTPPDNERLYAVAASLTGLGVLEAEATPGSLPGTE